MSGDNEWLVEKERFAERQHQRALNNPALARLFAALDRKPKLLEQLVKLATDWATAAISKHFFRAAGRSAFDFDSKHIEEYTRKHIMECLETSCCTRCGKPITGILRYAFSGRKGKVSLALYTYYTIGQNTGFCEGCIDEFLESLESVLKNS